MCGEGERRGVVMVGNTMKRKGTRRWSKGVDGGTERKELSFRKPAAAVVNKLPLDHLPSPPPLPSLDGGSSPLCVLDPA